MIRFELMTAAPKDYPWWGKKNMKKLLQIGWVFDRINLQKQFFIEYLVQ